MREPGVEWRSVAHASRRRDLPEPEGDAEAAEGPGSLRDRSSTARSSASRAWSWRVHEGGSDPIHTLAASRTMHAFLVTQELARSSTPISGGAISSTATFMHVSKMTRHLLLRTHVRRLTVPSSIMVGAPAGSQPGWRRGRRTMATATAQSCSVAWKRAASPFLRLQLGAGHSHSRPGRSDEQGAVALHALTQSMGLQELPLSDQSIIHPSLLVSIMQPTGAAAGRLFVPGSCFATA